MTPDTESYPNTYENVSGPIYIRVEVVFMNFALSVSILRPVSFFVVFFLHCYIFIIHNKEIFWAYFGNVRNYRYKFLRSKMFIKITKHEKAVLKKLKILSIPSSFLSTDMMCTNTPQEFSSFNSFILLFSMAFHC